MVAALRQREGLEVQVLGVIGAGISVSRISSRRARYRLTSHIKFDSTVTANKISPNRLFFDHFQDVGLQSVDSCVMALLIFLCFFSLSSLCLPLQNSMRDPSSEPSVPNPSSYYALQRIQN